MHQFELADPVDDRNLIRNFNGVLTLYLFSVLKTEKIDTQHAIFH